MHPSPKLMQSILRSHLPSFVAKTFFTVSPGTKYHYNWHINLISEKLKQIEQGHIKRLIINIPPRYLKSICVSVAWPAWLMGHNPACKIMTASYSQVLSNKHSQDCRLLMSSPWYQTLFPKTTIQKGENRKEKFVTSQRGFRFATSTGGTATGEGGDYLIIDDPQNPNKINSKKYRHSTIEWFEQTFASRLNNKKTGAIVLVMQRLHEEDLAGYLIKNNSEWELVKIPAIFEEKTIYSNIVKEANSVLHPEREGMEELNNLRKELGEYNFAAQYQQDPIPTKGTMVEKKWLQYFSFEEKTDFTQIIQSWDTAIKAKDENDYSVGITIGINDKGFYILDIMRIKAEFPELAISLQNFANKWNPHSILIEDKASGQSLIQTLKSKIKTPIIPIKPKFDKITRFAAHTPLFEAGKIFIEHSANWRIALEQELLTFPKSANDDQIDSLSQALNYLQQRKYTTMKLL